MMNLNQHLSHFIYSSKYRNILSIFMLAAFSIFLVAQHNLVFPYHDDWGYSVLLYGKEQNGFTGQNFSQGQLLNFLIDHYFEWSGRVVGFYLEINLFKLGLEYIRAAQVIVILCMAIYSVKLATEKIIHPLLFIPIIYFFALPVFTQVDGLYWFSASVSYVWSIPILLSGVFIAQQRKRITPGVMLIISCAATFHEQVGLASVAFTLSYIFTLHLNPLTKTETTKNIINAIPVIIAAALTIMAPGNFARKSVTQYPTENILELIHLNSSRIVELMLLHQEGKLISSMIFASFLIMCMKIIENSWLKYRFAGMAAIFLVMSFIFYFSSTVFFWFFLFSYGVGIFWLQRVEGGKYGIFCLYLSAVSTLVLLLVVPSVPYRALLPFYLIMTAVVTYIYSYLFKTKAHLIFTLYLICIFPLAVLNAAHVYSGFSLNRQANCINHYTLASLSFQIARGEAPPKAVTLYKLADDRYAGTMPYQRPLIETWVKKFYSLPSDMQFIWK